jgi:hypothetical protein
VSANPGLLVLDNNCYKALTTVESQSLLRRRAAMHDLMPAPSTVNLAESIVAPPDRRQRNLKAIKGMMGDYGLLPWPSEMLIATGMHMLRGGLFPGYEETGYEWLLDDPDTAGENAADIRAELDEVEQKAIRRFDLERPRIQKRAKELSIRGHWDGARSFLEYWWESDMAETCARWLWQQHSLPGQPPIEMLLRNEAWRLIIDADCLAMFARCVVVDQHTRVEYLDLLQLPYLSLRRKRVLVTNDESFYRTAELILAGRYENAKVVRLPELMAG